MRRRERVFPPPHVPPSFPLLLAALGLVLVLAARLPGAARAELIVFEDGRVVKAAGYRLLPEELEVELPGGGSYRVALERVERIVDDEVVVDTVAVEGDLGLASRAAYDLSYQATRKPLFGSAYDALIDAAAKRSNIDASFVSALIRAESNFEPRAVSRKGARGLMQLMPATARRLSVRRPFDPASNVDGGVRYLRELVDRFGNQPELVLAAYNAGEQAVETYGGVPPYRETVAYVNRILGWWQPVPLDRRHRSKSVGLRGEGGGGRRAELEAAGASVRRRDRLHDDRVALAASPDPDLPPGVLGRRVLVVELGETFAAHLDERVGRALGDALAGALGRGLGAALLHHLGVVGPAFRVGDEADELAVRRSGRAAGEVGWLAHAAAATGRIEARAKASRR